MSLPSYAHCSFVSPSSVSSLGQYMNLSTHRRRLLRVRLCAYPQQWHLPRHLGQLGSTGRLAHAPAVETFSLGNSSTRTAPCRKFSFVASLTSVTSFSASNRMHSKVDVARTSLHSGFVTRQHRLQPDLQRYEAFHCLSSCVAYCFKSDVSRITSTTI